jgi:hypothetical protein
VTAVAVAFTCGASLAACAIPAPATTPASPEVTASVYQPRTDMALNRIAIRVENTGPSPIELVAAELRSESFAEAMTWGGKRTATVAAGRALDLRVPIAEPDCDADAAGENTVVLRYVSASETAELALPAADANATLAGLWNSACLAIRVAEIATVTASEFRWDGPDQPGTLVVDIEPTGADAALRLTEVQGTTLLAPARDGAGAPSVPLDLAFEGTGDPTRVSVPFVPNRCDAHALAEDKVGTRIPFLVETSTGASGRLVLTASDALRRQMYAFFTEYCGL